MSTPLRNLTPHRQPDRRLSPEAFVTAARSGIPLAGAQVSLQAAAESSQGRVFNFTAATAGGANRNGWKIEPDAWELGSYRENPVVLWAHDDESLPLGRALQVTVAGNLLRARVEFTAAGLLEFNDRVVDLLNAGFLRGMSVGFVPLDWRYEDLPGGGAILVFTSVELVELSVVPVPADATALADRPVSSAAQALREEVYAKLEVLHRRIQIQELKREDPGPAGEARLAHLRAKQTFLRALAAKALDGREESFLRIDLDRCRRRIAMLEP